MCPNSSLSISSDGIAAQLSSMKALVRRPDASCSARATSSFPAPLSPVISTRALVGPTLLISSRTPASAGELPIIAYRLPTTSLSRWFSPVRSA